MFHTDVFTARYDDCMPTGHGHITVAEEFPGWWVEVGGMRVGKARVIWTNGEYRLVRECQRLQFDGSCVAGYEAVVVFAHHRHAPADDVIDAMMAAAGDCFHREDLELVNHDCESQSTAIQRLYSTVY